MTLITARPARPAVGARPLGTHALLFAVVLLAVAPFLHLHSSVISDEGAYAVQANALAHGTWSVTAPLGTQWYPYVNSAAGPKGIFPYVQHPAYPLLLSVPARLLGTGLGLHLLPILGALLTAVAAWKLAEELAPGRERLAFWVAALSPVLANATVLWAHTLSAAVGGLALWAALRIVRRGMNRVDAAVLGGCCAFGVFLRSEGLLLAAAAAVVLVAVRAWSAAVLAGGSGIAAAVVEHRWIAHITGGLSILRGVRETPEATGGYLSGRLGGLWHEVIDPALLDRRAVVVGSVALILMFAVALAARRSSPGVVPLTVLAGVALAVRVAVAPREPVTGILLAWPAMLWLVAGWRWRGLRRPARLAALVVGLFLLAVVATQYSTGGAIEWGWRFASPVLAPLAVLAAIALPPRRVARTCAIATMAVAAVASLVVVGAIRTRQAGIVGDIAATHAPVVITTEEALPRIAWSTAPGTAWLQVPRDAVDEALVALHAAGYTTVAVEGRAPLPSTDGSPYTVRVRPEAPRARAAGYDLVVLRTA